MEPDGEFPLPLDVLRYSIVPKTRRRELCFLRSTCRILRTAILLPHVVLTPRVIEKTAKDILNRALHLSESIEAVHFKSSELVNLAPLIEKNDIIKQFRADRTSDLEYHLFFDEELDPAKKRSIGSNLGAAFARIFQKPNKLTLLDLSNSILGPTGVTTLIKTLIETKNTTLKTLCLSRTGFELSGCRALAHLVEQSCSLTSLDVASNAIDHTGAELLAKALTCNTSLTELDVGCCFNKTQATVAVLSALKKNSSLKRLSINYSFYGTDVGNAFSDLLAVNTTLTSLNGSYTPHANVNVTQALAKLQPGLRQSSTLRELILQHCSLEDPCAFALAQAITSSNSLVTVDLGGEQALSLSGFYYSTRFSPYGVRALLLSLGENRSIQHFFLSSASSWVSESVSIPDTIAQLLVDNKTLKTLDLRGNDLGLKPSSIFFNALKSNASLLSLTLCDLKISSDVVPSFVDALKANTTLQELSLARNRSLGSTAAQIFAQYLEFPDAALGALNLSSCDISDSGAINLASSLAKNTSLSSLILSHNENIRNPSAQAFAKLLQEHQRLQILDLRNCRIASTGLKAIMQVCDSTKSISFLGLTGNLSGALRNPPESVAAFEANPSSRRAPIYFSNLEDDDFDDGMDLFVDEDDM